MELCTEIQRTLDSINRDALAAATYGQTPAHILGSQPSKSFSTRVLLHEARTQQ